MGLTIGQLLPFSSAKQYAYEPVKNEICANKPLLTDNDVSTLELYYLALAIDIHAEELTTETVNGKAANVANNTGLSSDQNGDNKTDGAEAFIKEYDYDKFYPVLAERFSPSFKTYFDAHVGAYDDNKKLEQVRKIQGILLSPPSDLIDSDKSILQLYFGALAIDLYAEELTTETVNGKAANVANNTGLSSDQNGDNKTDGAEAFIKEYDYDKFYPVLAERFSPGFKTYFDAHLGAYDDNKKLEQLLKIQAILQSSDSSFCAPVAGAGGGSAAPPITHPPVDPGKIAARIDRYNEEVTKYKDENYKRMMEYPACQAKLQDCENGYKTIKLPTRLRLKRYFNLEPSNSSPLSEAEALKGILNDPKSNQDLIAAIKIIDATWKKDGLPLPGGPEKRAAIAGLTALDDASFAAAAKAALEVDLCGLDPSRPSCPSIKSVALYDKDNLNPLPAGYQPKPGDVFVIRVAPDKVAVDQIGEFELITNEGTNMEVLPNLADGTTPIRVTLAADATPGEEKVSLTTKPNSSGFQLHSTEVLAYTIARPVDVPAPVPALAIAPTPPPPAWWNKWNPNLKLSLATSPNDWQRGSIRTVERPTVEQEQPNFTFAAGVSPTIVGNDSNALLLRDTRYRLAMRGGVEYQQTFRTDDADAWSFRANGGITPAFDARPWLRISADGDYSYWLHKSPFFNPYQYNGASHTVTGRLTLGFLRNLPKLPYLEIGVGLSGTKFNRDEGTFPIAFDGSARNGLTEFMLRWNTDSLAKNPWAPAFNLKFAFSWGKIDVPDYFQGVLKPSFEKTSDWRLSFAIQFPSAPKLAPDLQLAASQYRQGDNAITRVEAQLGLRKIPNVGSFAVKGTYIDNPGLYYGGNYLTAFLSYSLPAYRHRWLDILSVRTGVACINDVCGPTGGVDLDLAKILPKSSGPRLQSAAPTRTIQPAEPAHVAETPRAPEQPKPAEPPKKVEPPPASTFDARGYLEQKCVAAIELEPTKCNAMPTTPATTKENIDDWFAKAYPSRNK